MLEHSQDNKSSWSPQFNFRFFFGFTANYIIARGGYAVHLPRSQLCRRLGPLFAATTVPCALHWTQTPHNNALIRWGSFVSPVRTISTRSPRYGPESNSISSNPDAVHTYRIEVGRFHETRRIRYTID